jgi:hypothetical protein
MFSWPGNTDYNEACPISVYAENQRWRVHSKWLDASWLLDWDAAVTFNSRAHTNLFSTERCILSRSKFVMNEFVTCEGSPYLLLHCLQRVTFIDVLFKICVKYYGSRLLFDFNPALQFLPFATPCSQMSFLKPVSAWDPLLLFSLAPYDWLTDKEVKTCLAIEGVFRDVKAK